MKGEKKIEARIKRTESYKASKEAYRQRVNEAMSSGQRNQKTAVRLATEYGLNIDAVNAEYQRYMSSNDLSSDKKYQKAKSVVENNLKVLSNDYRIKYDTSTGLYTLEEK